MELPPQPAQSTPVAPLTSPTPPTQPTSPTPSPKKGKFLLFLGLLLGFSIYIIASYFLINRFLPSKTKAPVGKLALPTQTPALNKPEVLFTTKDIFSLSGWPKTGGPTLAQDGSFQYFNTRKGENQQNWQNSRDGFRVKGDFELQLAITATDQQDSKNLQGWELGFRNNPNTNQITNETRQIYVQAIKKNFFVGYFDGRNGPSKNVLFVEDKPLPVGNFLKIRFENINSGKPEAITVYDGNTNKEIGKFQIPESIFSKNPFYFDLALDLSDQKTKNQVLTISRFDIIAKKGDVTLLDKK